MPLNYVPGEGKKSSSIAFDKATAGLENQGLTERQQRLNQLYGWYTTNQYDNRKIDFDGGEYLDPLAREAIVTGSYLPPGFYDAGQQYPVRFRRPLAPHNIVRVIVDRFNELLFANNRAPKVRILGDSKTEDYVQAIIEATDLWGKMLQARKLGGAMGSVAVGFSFMNGKPRVEVHDPRWCFPDFEDRSDWILNLIEKRWIYTKEERVPDGRGGWKWGTVPYWYRRIISKTKDIVFQSVPVLEGDEPIWMIDEEKSVEHNLGFCPVVWIQNHEVLDDIDGESDCHGVYDQVEQMDLLNSMAIRGIVLNCFGVETEFVTHAGVRRFSDFKDGDACTVLTHTGQWREAVVKSFGKQQLYQITLQRGGHWKIAVIRATRNHRWLLEDGKETENLQVGDWVKDAPPAFYQKENSPCISWKVIAIEPDQEEIVWCLQEPVEHSMVLAVGIATGQCDPTPVIKEDKELQELMKGSDNTVKLTKGGEFSYVEISGNGPKAAFEAARGLKESIQEVVQVFLPPPNGAGVPKTATEVERVLSSMLAKADLLRKQYGHGIYKLLRMILKAAKRLSDGEKGPDGVPVRRHLKLPPKVVEGADGKVTISKRELGGGGHLKLVWPKFFEPTLEEIKTATSSAGEAKDKGLIDAKHASEFVASMYHVDNVSQMLQEMEEKAKQEQEAAAAQMGGGYPPPGY